MAVKLKKRSLDEVILENEYFLITAYLIFIFFSCIWLFLRTLKDKIFVR